jgi:AdoMet-dependent heme synthase
MRQRAKADGRPMPKNAHPHRGMAQHPRSVLSPQSSALSSPPDMSAMTKGCLAGQAVCFVSHTGEVFPCGYLPVSSGNVNKIPFPKIWRDSQIFAKLRDEDNLEGKCGACEYKTVCMGCRARAFAETHDYLASEPNCNYTPVRLRIK